MLARGHLARWGGKVLIFGRCRVDVGLLALPETSYSTPRTRSEAVNRPIATR